MTFNAVTASTIKQRCTGFDLAIKALGSDSVDRFDVIHVQIQVQHTAAIRTNEMIVRIKPSVVPIPAVGRLELANLTKFRQQTQIAVHSTETDIRKFLFNLKVNSISSRMLSCLC